MPIRPRVLAACAALGIAAFSPLASAEAEHWGYFGELGPNHWMDLDPAYQTCGSGKAQSPINIGLTEMSATRPPQFQYRATGVKVVNNGHTIQFDVEPGSRVKIGEKYFELKQFHVHTPSEHEVNGRQLPLEIHLVHQGDDGQIAVIGVLARTARHPHHALRRLWEHLPENKGESNNAGGLRMNPITLLPMKRSFVTYEGSFTTPPCTEGVLWLVMREPLRISDSQADKFSRIVGGNARPVQPLNDRKVLLVR
jgi:carbonic anhydrase